MGDFNAVYNPAMDRSTPKNNFRPGWQPEISIFDFLDDWGLIDIHHYWEPSPFPIWRSNTSFSRIDYIWLSQDIASKHLLNFSNQNFDTITNSDHTLLTVSLESTNLFKKSPLTLSRGKSTKILDISQCTEEQWTSYQVNTEHKFDRDKLDTQIQDSQTISTLMVTAVNPTYKN